MLKINLLLFFLFPLVLCAQKISVDGGTFQIKATVAGQGPREEMPIQWLYPETRFRGEQYERIEFSVGLPDAIREKVDYFLATDDSTKGINPFLEWNLDVTATFRNPATNTVKTVDAFYYSDYSRDTSFQDFRNWKWIKQETPNYMRVRFAPPEYGNWVCTVNIKTRDKNITLEPIIIMIERSNNPGYLEVGDSKRFFKLGEETFFPAGQNIVSPRCEWCFTTSGMDLPTPENPRTYQSFEGWMLNPTIVKGFTMYLEHIRGLGEGGGNYFRQILMPQNQDIEWEKLGNYYGRLNRAWEIDQQFFLAEKYDIKMQMNLQIQFALEHSLDRAIWNWSVDPKDKRHSSAEHPCANPYNTQIATTANRDPNTFFSDETAKKFYKQKLRYIVSRWGYSTSLGVIGMMSEIEGACTDGPLCASWMDEMGAYLKNDLEINQLLAPSFLSIFHDPENYEKPILRSEYYDFSAYNWYAVASSKFQGTSAIINDLNETYEKPFYWGEIGNNPLYPCDTARIEWVRDAWFSAFTGNAGVGMNWDEPFDDELRYDLGRINTFVNGIDFDGDGNPWRSRRIISDNRKAETLFLTSPDQNYAVGVISNRYYNWRLFGDTLINENGTGYCQTTMPNDPGFNPTKIAEEKGVWEREYKDDPVNYIDRVSRKTKMNHSVVYFPFEAFDYKTSKHYRLRLYGLKRAAYTVDFYNALTLEFLGSQTNWGPAVKLEYPEMNVESGLIAFKLRPASDDEFPQLQAENRIQIDYKQAKRNQTDKDITITNNRYKLTLDNVNQLISVNVLDDKEHQSIISILDEKDVVIFSEKFESDLSQETAPFSTGKTYTIKISIDRMVYTEKIAF